MARRRQRGSQSAARPNVATYLRRLHEGLTRGLPASSDGTWFSRKDEGSLFLDAQESAEHYRILDGLVRWAAPKEHISRQSVSAFLNDAIFEALDLRRASTLPFDGRLKKATSTLFARLNAPSRQFKCWVPVEGLKVDGPEARFGGARFLSFGPSQVRAIARARSVQGSKTWRHAVQFDEKDLVIGHTYAAVVVPARDANAARRLATLRVRAVIDTLNFFTDLVPYCHAWLYLRGETANTHQVVLAQADDGALGTSHEAISPLGLVSWKALRAERRLAPALRLLDRFNRTPPAAEDFASAIFAGAQWAGRATVARRREESFLLYAIALESMVLPTHDSQGSGFRLRLRVAHLLGRTKEGRDKLLKDVNALYAKRSQIAHAGSYDVTEEDLSRIRSITKGMLLRLATLKKLHNVTRQSFSQQMDLALVE